MIKGNDFKEVQEEQSKLWEKNIREKFCPFTGAKCLGNNCALWTNNDGDQDCAFRRIGW